MSSEFQRQPDAAFGFYTRVAPTRGWVAVKWKELWEYRELLYFLALRDISIRYRQTLLGAAWAVIVPLVTMIVFNLLFGLLLGPNGKPTAPGVPYAVSTFAALVPWQLFASAMGQSGNSLVASRNLITKVYFPRLIVPLAPILSSLVDFAIAFGVLLLMIVGYHLFTDYQFSPSWRLLLVPFFVVLAMMTALSLSLWLSALNVLYRDVRYIIPFLTQILMFVSPVLYTSNSVMNANAPLWLSTLYHLNPLVGVLDGFRWALFGQPNPSWVSIASSTLGVGLLLVGGAYYFRRTERHFADLS